MPDSVRIDKWLWFARFYKSRSLAASVVEAGEVRLNGVVVAKVAQGVKVGDDLVFPTGPKWRRVTVLALGERRGPAVEARALYEEGQAPPLQED
jgi:ribosome-associated heat shock protein Hsp15